MKKLAFVCCTVFAVSALAAENGMEKSMGATMAWHPRQVTKEDKKGIDELWKSMDEMHKNHDVNAFANLVDFPVYMVTDDATGNTYSEVWNKEKWMQMMSSSMKNM